jgi:stage II sporulation protein D
LVKTRKPTSSSPARSKATPWPAAPDLRVLLADRLAKLEFRVHGSFRLEHLDGRLLHHMPATERRWLVRSQDTIPAQMRHTVIVCAQPSARAARKVVEELEAQGFDSRIMVIGVDDDSRSVKPGRLRHRVLSGAFETSAEAAVHMAHFQNAWRPRLLRERVEPPQGRIELADATFKLDEEIPNGLRIVPEPGGSVTLYRLPCERFPESPVEDRRFGGVVEFRVDNHGLMAAVCELPLEDWLCGVLPAELEAGFPGEAQRAVAVALRSMALAMRGLRHMSEDWHFCAQGHCFHFSGLTHRSEACELAVAQSVGEVLVAGDEICDAVSHACCGGHGEHKENVWSTPRETVLTGRWDLAKRPTRKAGLEKEEAARAFILEAPAGCLCRVTRSAWPSLLESSRRGFRWREVWTRTDLEAVVRRKTGVDLGTLYEIVPVRRGASGRIIELELMGSRHNLRLQKELKIREALSSERLSSSCFTVHADLDADGLPRRFIFTGAGQGHGCGLCQVGAGALAENGWEYRAILEHYFPGTTLVRLYPAPAGLC